MPVTRPETVTFDCWSTVLYEEDSDDAHARRVAVVREYAGLAGREVDADLAGAALRRTWSRFDEHWKAERAPTPRDMADWILEFVEAPDRSVADELAEVLATQSLDRRVLLLEGVDRALASLSSAGVSLGLVCDTGYSPGSTLRRILDRLGVLDYFGVTTFSDEVGVPKPHPEMFHRTLRGLGATAEGSVHVGDLKRTDVAGARRVGMKTVRITAHNDDTSDDDEADAVVDSYDHLLEILGYR